MLRAAFACATYLMLAGTAAAQTDQVPAPASLDVAAIDVWMSAHIDIDGWVVIGADGVAVALGNASGVAQMPDGTLRTQIRHEYFEQAPFGDFRSRSNLQTRAYDCVNRRQRTEAMSIFEFSNMRGRSQSRTYRDAEWTTAEPGSLKALTMDRVCSAPIEGARLR